MVSAYLSKDIISGIAITSLIFAVAVYIPILGFACALLLPLPILFYRSKLGRQTASIIAGSAFSVMLLMVGRLSVDTLFFAELLLIGFVLSEAFELNISLERTVLLATVSALATGLLAVWCYSVMQQTGFVTLIDNYVGRNLELTLSVYQNMGMPPESIRQISDAKETIQYVLVGVLPALVTMGTLFVVWLSLLLAKPLFRAKQMPFPDFGNMNQWQAPENLVWVAIGCGLFMLVPAGALKLLGINGLLVLMLVYFLQGVAIVSFFFDRKGVPRPFRVLVYSLIALQQILLLIVIGMGFFDVWINFRKLGTDKAD